MNSRPLAGHELEGELMAAQGKHRAALEVYRRAARMGSDFGPASGLARTHAALGDRTSAKRVLQRYLEAHPEHRRARRQLAELQQQTGEPEPAIRTYEALLKTDSRNANLLNNLAWLKAEADAPAALALAERAHAMTPSSLYRTRRQTQPRRHISGDFQGEQRQPIKVAAVSSPIAHQPPRPQAVDPRTAPNTREFSLTCEFSHWRDAAIVRQGRNAREATCARYLSYSSIGSSSPRPPMPARTRIVTPGHGATRDGGSATFFPRTPPSIVGSSKRARPTGCTSRFAIEGTTSSRRPRLIPTREAYSRSMSLHQGASKRAEMSSSGALPEVPWRQFNNPPA